MKTPSKGSFRDPSGYIYRYDQVLYRDIMQSYQRHYDALMSSGLYNALASQGLLIPHTEIDPPDQTEPGHYKTIQPAEVPFISYPYEWCFSQLKDAALQALEIMKKSLDFNMILKDASAYNIQFHHGKPIFIDTLSFEIYEEGLPWVGYGQFCRHFVAPLALMSKTDIRLSSLLRNHIDGPPLDLASRLLPFKTKLSFSLLLHIHLHAKSQQKYANINKPQPARINVSQKGLRGIIDSLESLIKRLVLRGEKTEWANYYQETNYSEKAFDHKKRLVGEFVSRLGDGLIIEFVPKEDSQVQSMLASRENIFDNYNQASFEAEFGKFFNIIRKERITDSKRSLYLMS